MRTLSIASLDQLHQVDHRAVIAWERYMREVEHAAASTMRPAPSSSPPRRGLTLPPAMSVTHSPSWKAENNKNEAIT
jgi:hypothetical protein